MSTGAIVAIVVVVVLLVIAVGFLVPRARAKARARAEQRGLERRRQEAVTGHRHEAGQRVQRAEEAERRARIAAQEAERNRAEARIHEERAALYHRGLADHELAHDGDGERENGAEADQRTERSIRNG